MTKVDDLVNDIKEVLCDRTALELGRLPRLHPDRLLHRTIQLIQELEDELDERNEEIKDLEAEIKDIRYDLALCENA